MNKGLSPFLVELTQGTLLLLDNIHLFLQGETTLSQVVSRIKRHVFQLVLSFSPSVEFKA
jgi:hypothetical protein